MAIPLFVAAIVVIVDQVTKALAVAHLSVEPQHVFGPFGFQLTYNTGSAFSLLQGFSGPLIFVDLALVALLAYVAIRATSVPIAVGLALMLGGALGNLLDRAIRRHDRGVVDFITLTHWPTFNAGDAAITIGAGVVIVATIVDMARPSGEST